MVRPDPQFSQALNGALARLHLTRAAFARIVGANARSISVWTYHRAPSRAQQLLMLDRLLEYDAGAAAEFAQRLGLALGAKANQPAAPSGAAPLQAGIATELFVTADAYGLHAQKLRLALTRVLERAKEKSWSVDEMLRNLNTLAQASEKYRTTG
jgi:hypothetical protein